MYNPTTKHQQSIIELNSAINSLCKGFIVFSEVGQVCRVVAYSLPAVGQFVHH